MSELKLELNGLLKAPYNIFIKKKMEEHIPLVVVDRFFEGAIFVQTWWNFKPISKYPSQKRRKFYDGSWGKTIHTDVNAVEVTIDQDYFIEYIEGEKKFLINKSEILAYMRDAATDKVHIVLAQVLPHINKSIIDIESVSQNGDDKLFTEFDKMVKYDERIKNVSDDTILSAIKDFSSQYTTA